MYYKVSLNVWVNKKTLAMKCRGFRCSAPQVLVGQCSLLPCHSRIVTTMDDDTVLLLLLLLWLEYTVKI